MSSQERQGRTSEQLSKSMWNMSVPDTLCMSDKLQGVQTYSSNPSSIDASDCASAVMDTRCWTFDGTFQNTDTPAVAVLDPEAVDAALQAEEAELAPEAAPRVADHPERRAVLLAPAHDLNAQLLCHNACGYTAVHLACSYQLWTKHSITK